MPVDQTSPAEVDYECRQGSPYHGLLQFFSDTGATQPYDFTGYSFEMHIREGVRNSGAPLIMSLSSEDTSGQDARIFFIGETTSGEPDVVGTADPPNGFIYRHLTSTDTRGFATAKPPKQRNYPVVAPFFYDIEATAPGGEPFCICFGKFDVTLEVTD